MSKCIQNVQVCLKGKLFRQPCCIGTQKSHNVNVKSKVQETKTKQQQKSCCGKLFNESFALR